MTANMFQEYNLCCIKYKYESSSDEKEEGTPILLEVQLTKK